MYRQREAEGRSALTLTNNQRTVVGDPTAIAGF